MNRVTLCGRLVGNPEIKYSNGPDKESRAYTKYRLAVPRKYKKQNEEQPQTDFFNCVCFGTLAEFASKYFRKGGKILIAGRIENDSYTKDGQTFYGTKIIVEEHEFADSRKNENENTQEKEKKPEVRNEEPNTHNNPSDQSQDEYQRQYVDFMPADLEIPFR